MSKYIHAFETLFSVNEIMDMSIISLTENNVLHLSHYSPEPAVKNTVNGNCVRMKHTGKKAQIPINGKNNGSHLTHFSPNRTSNSFKQRSMSHDHRTDSKVRKLQL